MSDGHSPSCIGKVVADQILCFSKNRTLPLDIEFGIGNRQACCPQANRKSQINSCPPFLIIPTSDLAIHVIQSSVFVTNQMVAKTVPAVLTHKVKPGFVIESRGDKLHVSAFYLKFLPSNLGTTLQSLSQRTFPIESHFHINGLGRRAQQTTIGGNHTNHVAQVLLNFI